MVQVVQNWVVILNPSTSFDVRMSLANVYRMSEMNVFEFLVEGNTTSDNNFMNFINLLKAIKYPIIILVFYPSIFTFYHFWYMSSSKRPFPDLTLKGQGNAL